MPNRINKLLVSEYKAKFKDAGFFIAIGYEGLDIADTNRLRNLLAGADVQMSFVKNRLAQIAIKDLGYPDPAAIFAKQTAIITAEDPVTTARCIVDFGKENECVHIHGALVEGTILDTEGVAALAKSPTREELKSIISGQILAPAANLSSLLLAPGGILAGQVSTHIDNLEKVSA